MSNSESNSKVMTSHVARLLDPGIGLSKFNETLSGLQNKSKLFTTQRCG